MCVAFQPVVGISWIHGRVTPGYHSLPSPGVPVVYCSANIATNPLAWGLNHGMGSQCITPTSCNSLFGLVTNWVPGACIGKFLDES